jgi:hypothetical protein
VVAGGSIDLIAQDSKTKRCCLTNLYGVPAGKNGRHGVQTVRPAQILPRSLRGVMIFGVGGIIKIIAESPSATPIEKNPDSTKLDHIKFTEVSNT